MWTSTRSPSQKTSSRHWPGGKKFTKLDLSQAYQQLLLDEDSAKYVTVNTHRGLYRYNRLPFRVASAPALFQKLMDTVLQGIPNVMCYIDDILITGNNDEEHLHNLASVFERLRQHGLRLKKEKCEFLKDSVEFLGHKIDAEGLHAMPGKIEAIVSAPAPRNVQKLRSFLGLLNYYGKFVQNLSTLVHPLNALLQHSKKWKWYPQCAQAFGEAKKALSSATILAHYDPSLPLPWLATPLPMVLELSSRTDFQTVRRNRLPLPHVPSLPAKGTMPRLRRKPFH